MKIRKKIQMYNEFGFKVAFASFCSSAFRHPMAITRWKDKVFIEYLEKNYKNVIQKYKSFNFNQNNAQESSSNNLIWSIWWQGEENAPEVVKACFASVRRHCGDKKFKVITEKNFREYIQLPEHILKKVNAGVITLTHLSDILRMYLLYYYGGLWLDSTIFVVSDISDEIFKTEYFSIKTGFNPKSYAVTMGRWASFLQFAHKGSALCRFALECQLEFWKEHTIPIDYILIDYFFALAYQNFPEVKNMIDSVPLNNPEIETLRQLLNSQWDEEKFAALIRSTTFFKLTWKHKFEKNISGRETFYGHIINSVK